MTPSTQSLSELPDLLTLKQLCKGIAALEVIVCKYWEYRYYSYNKNWAADEEVFFMKDGSGDEFLILFNKAGAVINGFAHESPMNGWTKNEQVIAEGVLDGLPKEFSAFILGEPIKSIGTTFCIWRKYIDKNWNIGTVNLSDKTDQDGSKELLHLLDQQPASYRKWATTYYEEEYEEADWKNLPIDLIYNQEPITKELILKFKPEFEDWNRIKEELDEIGYPYVL